MRSMLPKLDFGSHHLDFDDLQLKRGTGLTLAQEKMLDMSGSSFRRFQYLMFVLAALRLLLDSQVDTVYTRMLHLQQNCYLYRSRENENTLTLAKSMRYIPVL